MDKEAYSEAGSFLLWCVMHWHMTALWAADCAALSLHPGDRLPCKVASLCMSTSDGEMTETKCYLSANSACVFASSVLWI